MKKIILLLIVITSFVYGQSKIFIPMDLTQSDHLKAYGITFNSLKRGSKADWLLNYKGGSFMLDYSERIVMDSRSASSSFFILIKMCLVFTDSPLRSNS